MSDFGGGGRALQVVPEDWDRAMAVVAHPDDIEYGAASAVARWTAQGKTVNYLLASRGEAGIDAIAPSDAAPMREAEERAGAAQVGVSELEFLDHRDGVIENSIELRRQIARTIRVHRPEVLITGNYDVKMFNQMSNQADHRAVGLAALDAARDAGNRWIFPEQITEDGLEPWGGIRFVLVGGTTTPTHGVDVSGEPLLRGIESLRAHAGYTTGLGRGAFDPAPFLTWVANQAGPAIGVASAVLFDLHWIIPPGPPPWVETD